MNRTHTTCGVAAGAWLAVAAQVGEIAAVTPGVGLIGVGLAGLAALTPDWDHPSAKSIKQMGPVGWILTRVLRLISLVLTGAKHRGITHSLVFAAGLGCLIAWIASHAIARDEAVYLGVSVAAGVVAALAGDLITKQSLDHVFWPFGFRITVPSFLRVKTNGRFERWIAFPVAFVASVAGILFMIKLGVSHG